MFFQYWGSLSGEIRNSSFRSQSYRTMVLHFRNYAGASTLHAWMNWTACFHMFALAFSLSNTDCRFLNRIAISSFSHCRDF